ncbi:TonB-dependent receptor domain-containing protein [Spirosoma flavum]|uniref:TonB-dependent receptor domain-containing protein n=1 Tax=Spirosoma flavum TaxID=2048557 RepID=A0ABW6ASB0_9BACT
MKAFTKQVTLLVLLITLSLSGRAQPRPVQITGHLADEKQQPVEFATVAVLKAADAALVKATYTDAAGQFSFDGLADGTYKITISYVGYTSMTTPIFTLSAGQPVVKIGSIALVPQSKQLAEVVVTGQKAVIEQKIDRMVLNVGALASNAGATALDILEKSPGVTVDQSGQVSLKGKKEVMIMLDDKLTYLSGDELANLLRSMSATQLDQIEIMTNPSAKYDAAGNAGIINIKTKKTGNVGFNGTLTLGAGYSPYFKSNDGLNLNYRTGKINAFANYSFIQNNGSFDIATQRSFVDATGQRISELNQSANRLSHSQTNSLKVGLDYFASAKTTLGFTLSGFLNPQRPTGNTTTTLADANGVTTTTIRTTSQSDALWRNGAVNLNARHQFSPDRELSASADYLSYKSTNAQTLLSNTYSPDGGLISQLPLRGDIPLNISIYTAKADYSQPVGMLFKLETGLKTALIQTNNQGNYFTQVNGIEQPDYQRSNQFNYRENINALYLNGSRQLGAQWFAQVGLRYENTQYTGHQLGNPVKPDSLFLRHYSNLFPTVFLSYKANEKNQLALSFGRRIDRPVYQDLNPFLSIIDQYSYSTGNPFLRPQFSTNVEVSHNYGGFLTTTLNYSKTDGFITETLQQQAGVIIRSVGNVASRDNAGLAVSLQLPITRAWSVNAFANGAYTHFNGTIADYPFNASAFSLNLNLTNQFTLGNGWAAEVSGFYHGRNRDEGQAIIRSISQVSLGLSKQLLEKRASLVFNLRDVFHSQVSREIQDFQNVVSTIQLTRDTRVANVSFVYRFGTPVKGATPRAKSSADEEKDRVKTF